MLSYPPHKDPFAILGVTRDASTDAIADAYRRLVREHPPQREPERFKAVREAYERLTNPSDRDEALLFTLEPDDAAPVGPFGKTEARALLVDALTQLAAGELGLDALSTGVRR